MCGIAGFSGDFTQSLLDKMANLIKHRGPDDNGEINFLTGTSAIGLAHRRLSIIDVSIAGRQPMSTHCACCRTDKEDKIWLIYNGELYNYIELRREMINKGHHFLTQTDSEVLLHLYAEFGPAMLKRLNGMFAFAIYDGRKLINHPEIKTHDLFLARDGMGVKPLYYSESKHGFLFASELKALLAHSELNREIDLTAIHYYLAYLWCPGQKTAMKSIKKIRPGEALIVRQGKIIKAWYFYDLPYHNQISLKCEKELILNLNKCLMQAIKRQLIADVPIGAFLSGGLDSSAIVAMMRELKPAEKINCYTIAFKNGMNSEGTINDLPYAKKVANHLNVNLNIIELDASMFKNLEHMIYHLDEPQADPAPIHVFLIAKAARHQGIKVLLSGAGGDDIFSGYRRHQALHTEKFWQWLPLSLRTYLAKSANQLLSGNGKFNIQRPMLRRLASLIKQMHLPADQRLTQYFLWNTESLRRNLYSNDMTEQVDGIETLLPLLETLKRIPNENNKLNRMLYLEGKHFLADHNLNYTDKMSMAAGVEVRVPLLDRDLVQLATSIPSRLKQKGFTSKYIFKKSMAPYLPSKIIYRPKAGFGAPIRNWIHHDMRHLINDVLSHEAIHKRGIFNPQQVKELIKNDKVGKIDGAYTIFSLLCIELWCQKFIDSVIS